MAAFDNLSPNAKRYALTLLETDGYIAKLSQARRLAEAKEKSASLLAQQEADKKTWAEHHSDTVERMRVMYAHQQALTKIDPLEHDDMLRAHAPDVAALKARRDELGATVAAKREELRSLYEQAQRLETSIHKENAEAEECRRQLHWSSPVMRDASAKCGQAAVEAMRRTHPALMTDIPAPVFWLTSMEVVDVDHVDCRSQSVCGCRARFESKHTRLEGDTCGGGNGWKTERVYVPAHIFLEACPFHRHTSDHKPLDLFQAHLIRLGITCHPALCYFGPNVNASHYCWTDGK